MTIVKWYRSQRADFGPVAATWLLWRVLWRRLYVVVCNKVLPRRFKCPCCGWEGRRFFDYIEMGYTIRNCACPRCDSHPRHRALFLWLRDDYRIRDRRGVALVFAPERALRPLWADATGLRVIRTDVDAGRDIEVLADVMHLPFANQKADVIWCHHVLEQVKDDRQALREFFRVLRSGTGELIISAGMTQSSTRELGGVDKALSGNRRLYGPDFVQRLIEAGFVVKEMSSGLNSAELREYRIDPQPFYCCRNDSNIRLFDGQNRNGTRP